MKLTELPETKLDIVDEYSPFDLMRWGKDAFYESVDQYYNARYGTNIEILEAETTFIENGLHIKILAVRERD